jgi:hypothetical protein
MRCKIKKRKTPSVLRLAPKRNLANLRVDDDQPRAKLQGFAPGMWDPRKVVQNAKLFARRSPAASCVATVASQVFANQRLATSVAKNRFRNKTSEASPQMTQIAADEECRQKNPAALGTYTQIRERPSVPVSLSALICEICRQFLFEQAHYSPSSRCTL